MTPLAITVGPFEAECYLLNADAVLIIDPGDDAATILDAVATENRPVAAYLLTHGHVDHLAALPALLRTHRAPVYLHAADAAWAFSPANQLPPFYSAPGTRPDGLLPIADGQTLELGGLTLTVIGTPGHTPGSVCYHLPGEHLLFSGDTLFDGSIGRTDLPGGDSTRIQQSLRRLATLPPETRIYPGHGPATTLQEQKRYNPFLKGE